MTKDEALKLALEALEGLEALLLSMGLTHLIVYGDAEKAITAIKEALAQPEQCQCPNCKVTLHASDCAVHNEPAYPKGACNCGAQPEQEPERVKFERHWKKTRGEKKANRELPRHPLQPQTYIQDSANRHWVTWQAAVRSVAPPAQRTWVGLTDEEIDKTHETEVWDARRSYARAIEAKLKEKNNA
jgi:hypothetical protein